MTNNKKLSATIFTIICTLTIISPVHAKQNNTNKQSNATLEETQRFIRQKINAIPEVPGSRKNAEIPFFSKSQEWAFNGCNVEFIVVEGTKETSNHYKIKFTLSDMRLPLELKNSIAQLPILKINTIGDKNNVTINYEINQKPMNTKRSLVAIFFEEQEIAERVAKALTHAIKLCSGKYEPEPF